MVGNTDPIICPECQHHMMQMWNGVLFCENCGVSLRDGNIQENSKANKSPRQVAQADIYVNDSSEAITIRAGTKLQLGRCDEIYAFSQTLDLSSYQGLEKGVSRTHAVLHWESGLLFIADLASINGTSVNGKCLTPHEPLLLHAGDEICLGQLALRVFFDQEIAPFPWHIHSSIH